MKQVLRILVSLIASTLLFGFLYLIFSAVGGFSFVIFEFEINHTIINLLIVVILGILFYFFLSNFFVRQILTYEKKVEDTLVSMNFNEMLSSIIGCVIGLIVANLVGMSVSSVPAIGPFLVTILNVLFGWLGFRVAVKRKDEFKNFSARFSKTDKSDKTEKTDEESGKIYSRPKVLDTSVIIDGRILDILQTGFIEGKIIIPNFGLEELRHIADSSDDLKRKKGRRGLDILNGIQNQTNIPVEIYNWDSKDTDEVDSKLLNMGKKLDAFVVTNDFNLNKVAEFQKVSVLNINELYRSVKTAVLPV